MNWIKWIVVIFGLPAVLGITVHAAEWEEPSLSPAEQRVIDSKIATLQRESERKIARHWSNAKKIAELICRPAAIPFLSKYAANIDKVFLGTDDPNTLILKSNQLLTGSGEFRTPKGWQDFTFICILDPNSGKVIKFQPVLLPQNHN